MNSRIFGTVLILITLVVVLAGCNGNSAGLNPVLNFTFPATTKFPVYSVAAAAGTPVIIEGTAAVTGTGNTISGYQWTQSPAGYGTFTSTATLGTTWVPNAAPAPGTTDNVTLTLTTTTSLGGKTVTPINLLIKP
jgi:hypothetical protein